jgi:thiamine-phosphate pyrophosphorylase
MRMNPLPPRGLYAVTPTDLAGRALLDATREIIAGGAVMVQYRAKGKASENDAEALQRLCAELRTPLIINDDPALAAGIGAAGVHIGRDDTRIAVARERVGPGRLVGVSCYDSLERAREAIAQGADYVAFGRFFPSRSKPGAVQAPMSLLDRARAEIAKPIVAIGGITPENGAGLLAAGADLLAVIDGVYGVPNRQEAARRYADLFDTTTQSGRMES